MKRKLTNISFILAFFICLTAIAFGQDTKGSVAGTVKDQTGAVVPNATVEVKGVSVGFSRTVNANADGYYTLQQIPPGIYKINATGASLVSSVKEITITLGNTTIADIELRPAGTTAQVDVLVTDNNLAIDSSEAKVQTNITAQQIENLPKGTTFSSLLRTTASTRPEALSGGFQINGSSGAENSFVVDGQEVGNFRTGGLNTNNDIPFQAVQEVQVKSSGFEAEFGGATGGVVSVVTKSGTNEFRGEAGMAFATQKFNAGPRPILSNTFTQSTTTVGGEGSSIANSGQFVEYFPQIRPEGNNVFPSFSLGGRIIKDRLWFYAIHSPQRFETTQTTTFVTGFPGNGSGRVLIRPANFASTLPDVVKNVNPTQTSTSVFKNEFSMVKLDASPRNDVRLSGSYTWNPAIQKGLLQGSTTVIGTPSFADFGGNIGYLVGDGLAKRQGGRQNSNNLKTEVVWTPTSNTILDFRYSRGFLNEKLGSYFIPAAPRIRCTSVSAALSAQAGCVTGFQTNRNNFSVDKDVSIRNTIDADFTYLIGNFVGKHDLKFGYQYSRIFNDVKDGYKPYGDIRLCYGTTLTINSVCAGYSSPVAIPTPTPPAGQTMIGLGWVQRFATEGKASNIAQTFYVQDKWQPTSRLTLSLGLRAEKEDLPAFNGQNTNLKFGFGEKLTPRLGAAYAITGDGKTKVAAFYGWFYDRLKFELPRGSFGGDFFRRDIFPIWSGTPLYTNYTVPIIVGNFADPIAGQCPITQTTSYLTLCNSDFRVPSNLPNSTTGAVDPNLKPYRQSEFTFEFQRELMKNSVLTVRYLYRNVDHAIEDAGWISASGSETYIIANPGEGLHAAQLKALGYAKSVKPQRRYDALQMEYNTRMMSKIDLNLNYTYSRLYGNYSGLASSDEGGRLSPGVNRFFDLPWIGWTASGQSDNGPLATDRPHVFKASGTYNFDWWGNKANSTAFSFFTFAQSGTPLTSFVQVMGLPIPETKRGDLGRTPLYTQTDFSMTHKYKFGRDNGFTLAMDVNILNIFNEANKLGFDTNKTQNSWYDLDVPTLTGGNYVTATNLLTSTGVISLLNSELTSAGCEAYSAPLTNAGNFCLNQAYKKPNAFQGPRSVRFGIRLLF